MLMRKKERFLSKFKQKSLCFQQYMIVNAENSSCLLSKSLFRLKKLYLSSFNHCRWSDLGSNPQKGQYLSKNQVKLVC